MSAAATRRRRAGEEVLTIGFFVVLSMAWWWPIPLHLRTHQLERVAIDSAFNQWILGWGSHAITSEPWNYFAANAYHPHEDVLAWGDHLFALALLTVPLQPLVGLVGAYNVLLLASSALTGYFTHLLLRELGAIRTAAVIGGVLAAFSSVRVLEHGHLQVLSTQWIPLVFLFAERLRRKADARSTLGLGMSALAVLATNVYLAIFTVLAFSLWTVVRLATRRLGLRSLGLSAAAWIGALLVSLPLYLPSIRLQAARDVVRPLSEQHGAALEGFDPRQPPGAPIREIGSWVGLEVSDAPLVPPSAYATPGLVLLGVVGASLIWRALRQLRGFRVSSYRNPIAGDSKTRGIVISHVVAYSSIAVVAVLASFGPSIRWRQHELIGTNPAFHIPYRLLPGYDALRVPVRWLLIATLVTGVIAGLVSSDALAAIRRRALRVALAIAVGVGVVVEQSAAPWPVAPAADIDDHPSMAWLRDQPRDTVIVELPITGDVSSAVTQEIEARRLLFSAMHLRRRVNGGISPYIPATYGDRVEIVNGLGVNPQALAHLRAWDVDYVLFEPADQLRYAERMRTPAQVEADLDALDGLERIRTFEDAIVYRVER